MVRGLEAKQMKLTKTQLKQIIKEALTDEDLAQVMDLLNPVLSGLEDNRKVVDQNVKVLQAIYYKTKQICRTRCCTWSCKIYHRY